jgi:hypothetical protein
LCCMLGYEILEIHLHHRQ